MYRRKNLSRSIMGMMFLILALVIAQIEKNTPSAPVLHVAPTQTQTATVIAHVVRIVDGDTIELSSGEKVRYIGIDTPELHSKDPQTNCFGAEAAQKNRELVEDKDIVLEKDISETDRYGRWLRYAYIDGVSVNLTLVRLGFARAKDYPPDSHYKKDFADAEKVAKEGKKGLWEKCA